MELKNDTSSEPHLITESSLLQRYDVGVPAYVTPLLPTIY